MADQTIVSDKKQNPKEALKPQAVVDRSTGITFQNIRTLTREESRAVLPIGDLGRSKSAPEIGALRVATFVDRNRPSTVPGISTEAKLPNVNNSRHSILINSEFIKGGDAGSKIVAISFAIAHHDFTSKLGPSKGLSPELERMAASLASKKALERDILPKVTDPKLKDQISKAIERMIKSEDIGKKK